MRTRDVHRRGSVERPSVAAPRERPLVLDRDLTYHRDGMRWTYSNGKVFVDGFDVNRLMNENPGDVGMWMGIAESLDDYRKKIVAASREGDQFAKFEALVEALLGKILGRLKRHYDQKMTGLHWSLENGQLILNGINIRSFLALYRLRKTDKARRFLRGLRGKLSILLENRRESPDYERIHEIVEGLYGEIDSELAAEEAPRAARRLLPLPRHAS